MWPNVRSGTLPCRPSGHGQQEATVLKIFGLAGLASELWFALSRPWLTLREVTGDKVGYARSLFHRA
jgi:hypothetical protein